MLRRTITRTTALAAAAAALALAAFAGPASAAVVTTDPVLMNQGNVGFGTSFSGNVAVDPGDLVWNESGANTTPRLTGSLYVENYTGKVRMVIEHYPSFSDHSNPITRYGGEKQGTGSFLDVFPITLGGVNSTYTHVHILIQKKDPGGSWVAAGVPDIESL